MLEHIATSKVIPQKILDERSFPITAFYRIPEGGFAGIGIDPHKWMQKKFGVTEFATTSMRRAKMDCFAIHLRRIEDLVRFAKAFPQLELADGTNDPSYRSPHLPNGRPSI